MITKVESGGCPTFKAKILRIKENCSPTVPYISSAEIEAVKKQFKQIGNDKDCFEHDYDFLFRDMASHWFDYFREDNMKKRIRFKLVDNHFLSPPEALRALVKAIMAKEPITTQNSNKIERVVQFPGLASTEDLKIEYFKQYSQSEDNFYYRNGKKAVCVQNVTPDKGVAEYYDKNGNLQFKKYKTQFGILTEKYNKDGQISYKIISDSLGFPIVIKDNKIFQMYAYKVCKPIPSEKIIKDYRVLIEYNNNKPLRYYLDTTQSGIRPQDAPLDNYYRLVCDEKHPWKERFNEEYAKELMKKNPLYTPEHLKELYLFPHNFSKEFIEDNVIFNTNYKIRLDDNKLKPNTDKVGSGNLWDIELPETEEGHCSEQIVTTVYGNPRQVKEFELLDYNYQWFYGIDNLWERVISSLQKAFYVKWFK